MSSYKEFRTQTKRRRAKRVAGRVFLFILILVLIFAACYVGVLVLGDKLSFLKDNPEQITSISQPPTSEAPVTSPMENDEIVSLAPQSWNSLEKVARTINTELPTVPDYRIYSLPKNGRVSEEYFASALFIGDSLTQGMGLYEKALNNGRTNVCAYIGAGPSTITNNTKAKKGKNVYAFPHDEIFAVQPNDVYILMGTNTIVSAITDEAFIKQYADMLDFLKSRFLPGVKFYVQGMPPVTAATAASRPKMNNDRIRELNNQIARIAHERDMFYLDLQEILADADGNLPVEIASSNDGFHLTPDGYAMWKDYLATHTVFSKMHAQYYIEEPYSS